MIPGEYTVIPEVIRRCPESKRKENDCILHYIETVCYKLFFWSGDIYPLHPGIALRIKTGGATLSRPELSIQHIFRLTVIDDRNQLTQGEKTC
jgi:hypothetical protein